MRALLFSLTLLACRPTDPVADLPPAQPDTAQLAASPSASVEQGPPCGKGRCPVGEACCNAERALCGPPNICGDASAPLPPAQTHGPPCGKVTCPVGKVCCNPVMGICTLPGEMCAQ